MSKATYEIKEQGGFECIKCLRCGLTSYNSNDVKEKFCGYCDEFHEYPFLSPEKNAEYIKQHGNKNI